jgi:hypothetical protein
VSLVVATVELAQQAGGGFGPENWVLLMCGTRNSLRGLVGLPAFEPETSSTQAKSSILTDCPQ